MSIPKVVPFIHFANGVESFQKEEISSKDPNLSRLKKSYNAFIQSLAPQETNIPVKKICSLFKQKYHVALPLQEEALKENLIAYTKTFRQLYPQAKLETQEYGFQLKNSKDNPFAVQWSLIKASIEKSPDLLTKQLFTLTSLNPDFDARGKEFRALLDAGGIVSDQLARAAFVCDDSRFFDLLISSYGYKPTSADFEFLCELSDFDKKVQKTKLLISKGVPFPSSIGHLVCEDMNFFEFLLSIGYQPTSDDLKAFFTIKDYDVKVAKTKMLIGKGIPLPSHMAHVVFDDLPSFKLLLSYGYQLTNVDLHNLIQKYNGSNTDKMLVYFEIFKANGYVFSREDCFLILDRHFSHAQPPQSMRPWRSFEKGYELELEDNCSSKISYELRSILNRYVESITPHPVKLTQKLIDTLCLEPQLLSVFFHSMPKHVWSLLAFGYQPTFEDLKTAISSRNKGLIETIMVAKNRFLNEEEVLYILSLNLESVEKQNLLYKMAYYSDQALFRKTLDRGCDIKLIIKDSHNYSNSAQNRSSGRYVVEYDDLIYAISKKVSSSTFDLLVHCWSYHPPKKLFQEILQQNLAPHYLQSLIDAGYRVDREDFRYACENGCSSQTLSLLLNFGRVNHYYYVHMDYQGAYENCTTTFCSTEAGYIPTHEDLSFAKEKGCQEDILQLIEKHLSREPFYYSKNYDGYEQKITGSSSKPNYRVFRTPY